MPIPPTIPTQRHTADPLAVRPEHPLRPSRSLASDLYRGVIWGDFDQELDTAGAVAQSIVGFIPIAGTIAALRDLIACTGQRDPLGVLLNILAIFPVLGGFAKIADAARTLHRYHRAARRRKQRAHASRMYQPSPVVPSSRRRSGWASLGLTLLVTCSGALYSFGVGLLFDVLRANGPTIQGYSSRGSGAWLAPLILLPLGLLVGVAVTVTNRLWLGFALLPLAMVMGWGCAFVLFFPT